MHARAVVLSAVLLVSSAAPAVADPGRDFAAEVRLLHRVAACRGDAPVPAAWTQVVDQHCAKLDALLAKFQARYAEPAGRFLAALRPAGLPTAVLYPFGGGDLASALITYPDATEITTMSLEHAGDVRPLGELDARELGRTLADFRTAVRGLLTNHDSASVKMIALERSALPGQLAFFLTGAAALGLEPVGLRYFRLADDGTIDYLDDGEIAALATTRSRKKHRAWVDTGDSAAFDSAELTLRRADGSTVIHRHIAANLDDAHLRDSPLHRHLVAKGELVALTKAASYCLWNHGFSVIRDLLVAQASFMVSDSTGIPPSIAKKAGLVQTTYGAFTGAYLVTSARHGAAMVALWASQPRRKLGFRYGYPDAAGNVHLMITRRPPR